MPSQCCAAVCFGHSAAMPAVVAVFAVDCGWQYCAGESGSSRIRCVLLSTSQILLQIRKKLLTMKFCIMHM